MSNEVGERSFYEPIEARVLNDGKGSKLIMQEPIDNEVVIMVLQEMKGQYVFARVSVSLAHFREAVNALIPDRSMP